MLCNHDCNLFILVAQSGSPVNVVEKEFHLFEEFKSDWCTSPLRSSPAPHWFLNGVLLNDGENNTHNGVMINRSISNEGHHQSQFTIPKLTSSMNDSTVICVVDSVVLWEYHLIIGEWNIQLWVYIAITLHAMYVCRSIHIMYWYEIPDWATSLTETMHHAYAHPWTDEWHGRLIIR